MELLKTWLSLIVAEIIDICINLNHRNCPGCTDGIQSPILHHHNALNLKDIIEKYLDQAWTFIDLKDLFNKLSARIEDQRSNIEQSEFIKMAESLKFILTAKAIYYGDYINVENEKVINDLRCTSASLYSPSSPKYEPSPVLEYQPTPVPKKRAKKNNTTSITKPAIQSTDILNSA